MIKFKVTSYHKSNALMPTESLVSELYNGDVERYRKGEWR